MAHKQTKDNNFYPFRSYLFTFSSRVYPCKLNFASEPKISLIFVFVVGFLCSVLEIDGTAMSSNILLEMLATAVGIIGSFAMLPQVYRIFKRKSAKDISITTFSFLFAAGIIWVLYGIDIESFPIVISNLAGSIIIAGIIIGWFLYGRTKTADQT